jgi:hypothetical protein
MMLYFVLFKHKKNDNNYRMFTNMLFDEEKKAEDFGKKSMKRGYIHKVVEYNNDNVNKYWTKL